MKAKAIVADEAVIRGILTENDNPDYATNHNDESGRYRMPILRAWELDGDVPTLARECAARFGQYVREEFNPGCPESWRKVDQLWRTAIMARDAEQMEELE